MGHTFQRVFGFFVDPFINRESATGFKRVLLEIYGGVLGIILLASFFALSGVLNSMCPVPKAATSTNLVVARRCWCVTNKSPLITR